MTNKQNENLQKFIALLSGSLNRRCDCACYLVSHSELEPFPCQSCGACAGYTEGGVCPPELAELAAQLIEIVNKFAPLLVAFGVELPPSLGGAQPAQTLMHAPADVPAPGLVPAEWIFSARARAHAHEWKLTEYQPMNFEQYACNVCGGLCVRSTVADFLIYKSPRLPREVYVWKSANE